MTKNKLDLINVYIDKINKKQDKNGKDMAFIKLRRISNPDEVEKIDIDLPDEEYTKKYSETVKYQYVDTIIFADKLALLEEQDITEHVNSFVKVGLKPNAKFKPEIVYIKAIDPYIIPEKQTLEQLQERYSYIVTRMDYIKHEFLQGKIADDNGKMIDGSSVQLTQNEIDKRKDELYRYEQEKFKLENLAMKNYNAKFLVSPSENHMQLDIFSQIN